MRYSGANVQLSSYYIPAVKPQFRLLESAKWEIKRALGPVRSRMEIERCRTIHLTDSPDHDSDQFKLVNIKYAQVKPFLFDIRLVFEPRLPFPRQSSHVL